MVMLFPAESILLYVSSSMHRLDQVLVYISLFVLCVFRVLLRVRTLYYLKHEVLGDAVDQIDQGMHVK